MTRLIFTLGLCALLPFPSLAQDAPASEAAEPEAATEAAEAPAAAPVEVAEIVPGLSDGAKELLTEEEDGKPLVSPEAREYAENLPAHLQGMFSAQVEAERISGAAHAAAILELRLKPQQMEVVLQDKCVLCHTNPDEQSEETLFTISPTEEDGEIATHLDLKTLVSDVHFRRNLACAGCHGGSPDDDEMADEIYERWPDAETRHTDRSWIPNFCGTCHGDAQAMRAYNPNLPTDQLSKYLTSKHGQLLLGKKDSKAAQCVSCHGVHGILRPTSPLSSVYPLNIPDTCGQCHAQKDTMAGYLDEHGKPLPTNQVEDYRASVHGKALFEKGDLGAPVCNDCHGNHAAMPPKVSSVAQICRTCHVVEGQLFDGSAHKAKFEKNGWPECETCHGKHRIERPSREMIGNTDGTICHECHAVYSKENPECDETAAEFRKALDDLHDASADFEHEIHELAERGMDVEPLEGIVADLGDTIKKARADVHSFEPSIFGKTAKAGFDSVDEGKAFLEDTHQEFSFRRQGLGAAIGIIAFLAIVLWLKIREIEKK